MCKNFIKSVFGGGDDPQAPGVVQATATARPVQSVVKNVDAPKGNQPIYKKKVDDPNKRGVPGLGL